MQETNRLRTREQKLKFLRKVREGTTTFAVLQPSKVFNFMCTNEPGIYYQCKFEKDYPPLITNGEIKRFTKVDIEVLKKKPNHWCIVLEHRDNRRPFPTIKKEDDKEIT